MKKTLLLILIISSLSTNAQTQDTSVTQRKNSAQTLIDSKSGNLLMAAYGEVHYNQPLSATKQFNGSLDVHRQVLLFGYKFNNKTSFITEIEIEHIKEVFLEQAFLNYQAKPWLNVQAGLLLIPMGIINEYHEPTTFNGVERPGIDNVLIPTTWRELGAGVAGNIPNVGLRYQLYAVNGPLGFNGEGQLNGQKPIRGARQKGSQVTMTNPDFSGRLTYYGVKGLDLGVSGYVGQTESTLFNNLHKDSAAAIRTADSSRVGVRILGLDYRYQLKRFESRGQFILSALSNTEAYNQFTNTDLASSLIGYYVEVGCDVSGVLRMNKKLVPFVRYSFYDTHNHANEGFVINETYQRTELMGGLTFFITPSVVVKTDYQYAYNGNNDVTHQINTGVGYWFR